jgi:23S rRNA pseudouridine1911/1915/1917 synthase
MRKIQYKIEAQHHEKNIGIFLREKEFSRGVLIQLKKEETGIIKNGVHAGVNEKLYTGDLLEVCLTEEIYSEKIVPKECVLDILYEDEDLLVVNKPYDMPIHPSIHNYENTLANGVMYYAKQKKTLYPFRCMNRLDRDTTGAVIIAKNLLSASILSKRVQEGKVNKTYIAFALGITKEEDTIDLPIGRMEGSIIKRRVVDQGGQRAVTHYKRLDVFEVEGKKVSAITLQLETGRTHQIRVHMAAVGHPLLGDFLYNENNHMLTRQALHASECAFKHPITDEPIRIAAPLPEDMKKLVD